MAPKKAPAEAAKPEEQKVATRAAGGALATGGVPSYLQPTGGGPRGLEDVEQKDLIIPRLQIAQAMSPELKPQNPEHIAGLEQGQLFNTVTHDVYGMHVQVIPMWFFRSRIFFKPQTEGGGIVCISHNGQDGGSVSPTCEACPKSKWGSAPDGKGIECTEFKNYPCLLVLKDQPLQIISVSLKSTGIKVANRWNTLMRLRGTDAFAGVYDIKVVPDKSAAGEFFNYHVDNSKEAWCTPEQYAFAKQMYENLRAKRVQVDASGLGKQGGDTESEF